VNVVSVVQGTPEWLAARAGRVTASRISDLLAKGKNGESASRANYRAQIIAERLTGQPAKDGFESAAMRRGAEQELYARAAYEARHQVLIDQVGIVLHPSIEWAAGSPDGLVGLDGGVEIKCPNTATHIDYILRGVVPSKYVLQMQWLMACTERPWWDFASFDNRLPEELMLFVKRLPRDEKLIAEIEAEVRRFIAEVDEYIDKLTRKVAV
jgi:putative phage-type endonuclease